MAQQGNRKIALVLLAIGAPVVVAVAGVSLGLAGGWPVRPRSSDHSRIVVLRHRNELCGPRDRCQEHTPDAAFAAEATNGEAALYGTNSSTGLIPAFGVWDTSGDIGVYGSGAVIGVGGDSTTGTGVSASSLDGTALNVDGKAVFSRSGVAAVAGTAASPKNSVQVRLPEISSTNRITAKSMMTALL